MNPWWIVVGILLVGIVFVLWLRLRPGVTLDELIEAVESDEQLETVRFVKNVEQLGQEAWSTLQRLSRTARADGRQLRAIRMNPETAAGIRLAVGQYDPGYLPMSGSIGRLYGIDVLISPAVPDGVIIPVDVGHDRLDEIVAALDTPPAFPLTTWRDRQASAEQFKARARADLERRLGPTGSTRETLDRLLDETQRRIRGDDNVDPA